MTRLSPYIFAWGLGNHSAYKTSCLSDVHSIGLKNITLAFLVSDRYEEILSWKEDIAKFKDDINVTLSLGGAAGSFLDHSSSEHVQAQKLVGLLGELKYINRIDLDIEGKSLEDSNIVESWIRIIREVCTYYPNLEFTLTLPVEFDGLNRFAVDVIRRFNRNCIKISFVNLMLMDFYTPLDLPSWSDKHIQLLNIVQRQLKMDWSELGVCPMIGENDDHTKFTLEDWDKLLNFAVQHKIGLVTFWAINRDQKKHLLQTHHGIDTHSRCQSVDLGYTNKALEKTT